MIGRLKTGDHKRKAGWIALETHISARASLFLLFPVLSPGDHMHEPHFFHKNSFSCAKPYIYNRHNFHAAIVLSKNF